MNRNYQKSLGLLVFLVCAAVGSAQTGGGSFYDPGCWPQPQPAPGFSDDYQIFNLPNSDSDNQLFGVTLGIGGTDTYGKQCIDGENNATFNSQGRIGFSIGQLGSVQSTFDDYLRLNFGMPLMVGGSIGYAMVTQTDATGANFARNLFGAGGFSTAFTGASDRYFLVVSTVGNFRVRLQVDLIGDAARLNWRMTNTTAAAVGGGLWFGQWVTFLTAAGDEVPVGFVDAPGYRPLRTPQRFKVDPSQPSDDTVPRQLRNHINFSASQENAYGLQVVARATSNNGVATSDQTPVDEIAVARAWQSASPGLLGYFTNNAGTMPDNLIDSDIELGSRDVGYIQKWTPTIIAAGQTREINAYYKSTWSVSDYAKPFSVVLDAPNVISTEAGDPSTLTPNPFTVRVYVDNTRGYSTIDQEVAISDLDVELSLPPGMTNAEGTGNESIISKTISRIEPRRMSFVDFRVRLSDTLNGFQPYSVKVSAPTGAQKILSGRINVASTPRLALPSTSNLVSTPWLFNNNSWSTILGLKVDEEFQAFSYDPLQREYVIQTSPQRGKSSWLVVQNPTGSLPLGGGPAEPSDITTGAPLTALSQGWNLIGNPYNYGIPLGQINGIVNQAPTDVITFAELVQERHISSALAYWDADGPTPEYKYIQTSTDLLLPNKGYWMYVFAANDPKTGSALTLSYPPVYEAFVPSRSTKVKPGPKDFKLQLAARNETQSDAQNFVGVMTNAAGIAESRVYEAPAAPIKGALSLSIKETINGQPANLATSYTGKLSKKSWTVEVYSKSKGAVTLTWPNLASVPKNVQFRVTDLATKTTKNLRRTSGYTFQAEDRMTRTFLVEMEPGLAARPTIGAVLATRSGRSSDSPLTIAYTLAGDATTTVRILSGGKEIYVPARGRADQAGQNTVVWNLRDSANRSVAPGPYTIEIIAESQNGDRVRKFFPVNIIR